MALESGDLLAYIGIGVAVIVVIIGLMVALFFVLRRMANRSSAPPSNRDRPVPQPPALDRASGSPAPMANRSSASPLNPGRPVPKPPASGQTPGSSGPITGRRLPPTPPVWRGPGPPTSSSGAVEQNFTAHIVDLQEAGSNPDLKWLPDNSCVVVISSYLPGQQTTAHIYIHCDPGFPHSPPQPIASVDDGLTEYGEIKEKEVALVGLETISNWNPSSSTLLKLLREIEAYLDEELVETTEIYDIFTK